MSSNNCLGIYFGKNAITAVAVSKHHHSFELGEIRNIDISENFLVEPDNISVLQSLKSLPGKASMVSMALDGIYYKSHPHHTEFLENKQIDQVLRYDIEDSFAVDAEEIALCYQKENTSESGCDIIVHVTNRHKLNNIIEVFENAGIDPLTIEPDINAWLHYINNCPDGNDNKSMVLLGCTDNNLFIVVTDSNGKVKLSRNIPAGQKITKAILSRELKRTFSILPEGVKPTRILWHNAGLAQAEIAEIAQELNMDQAQANHESMAVAIAAGAAMGLMGGQQQADFRADNLKPKAVIKARNFALYSLSVAVCLLLCVILLINFQKIKVHKETSDSANEVIAKVQKLVFADSKTSGSAALKRKLDKELKALMDKTSGEINVSDSESANGNLLALLNALNKLDENFNFIIEEIDINEEQIRTFRGSVLTLADYELLSNQLKESGLESIRANVDNAGIRIDFTFQLQQK
ncbi:MAG: hypothetical protein JEZ07_09265 [Phycisphaerae bacterium]|nr:hypothetical protein [Phycisphaerae bacterium]